MTTDADSVTVEELIQMPEEGYRYELVRGEIIQMPVPGHRHGRLVAHFAHHLWNHIEAEDLGVAYARVGYLLTSDPDTVRAPDASFISRERLDEVGETDGSGQALLTLLSRSSLPTIDTRT